MTSRDARKHWLRALQSYDGAGQAKVKTAEYIEESRILTRLLVRNVKPRDFEPLDPFVIQGRPYIDEMGDFAVLTDDDDERVSETKMVLAHKLVLANPKMSKSDCT